MTDDERRALVPVKPPRVSPDGRVHDGAYDRATADEIIFRLSHGEFLAWVCRDPRMPSYPEAAAWVVDDVDGFRARYDRALALGHDYVAASVLEDAEQFEVVEKRTITYKANGQTELKIERGDYLEHRKFKVATKLTYLSRVSNRYAAAANRLAALKDDDEEGGLEVKVTGGLPEGEP